tara:strand:+ start:286 stop:1104 length:819 start_codon:yes stop_codon:yes gene_type:complete
MIIWIASYPKSGNTWIRSLISTYLYSTDGEFNFDLLLNIPKFIQEKYISPVVKMDDLKKDPLKINEYWESAQIRINLDNKIKFFKTHNACVSYKNKWFTNENNTVGYIYVVRDPRSVACSLAHHTKISIEESVQDLLNNNQVGYNGPYKLAEIASSWKTNYLSWKKEKKFNGIIIKYENLIDDTEKEFRKILNFLNKFIKVKIDEKKLLKSIDSCQFSKLRKMEDQYGFKEATNEKFFRTGKKDSWKKELSVDLRRKLEENFKDEMQELGYL